MWLWPSHEAKGKKGSPRVAPQGGPLKVEVAAYASAGQADRTSVAGDPCPAKVQHPAAEPVCRQRPLGRMLKLASAQGDEGQLSTPGNDAFLQEAIPQLKADIRDEVVQVKPAGDPCPPKPQPMWIGIRREPPPQDLPDHVGGDAAGLTP